MKTLAVLAFLLLSSCVPEPNAALLTRIQQLEAERAALLKANQELAAWGEVWMQLAIETEAERKDCEAKFRRL